MVDMGDNIIEGINEFTHPPSQVNGELAKVKASIRFMRRLLLKIL